MKGDEDFAISRIDAGGRVPPILHGLTEERVVAAVAEVTGISVTTLRGRVRGGSAAAARCLAGYAGKRLGRIPLSVMARHLGREESYLVRGVSVLEEAAEMDQHQAQLDAITQTLRRAKSGFHV